MNIIRATGILAVAVALPLAACGKREAADPPADPGQTMETADSPSMEGGGPEPPRTGDGGVAVTLPRLPVGGGTDDDTAVRQCAVALWVGNDIPDGVSVTVADFGFATDGLFEVDGSRCGEDPGCLESFAFTADAQQCSVPVRALTRDASATRLLLFGSCEGEDCGFLAESDPGSVELSFEPPEPPSESSETEEPTEPSEPTEPVETTEPTG